MGDAQQSNAELSSRWIQHGMRYRDQKQWSEALEAFDKAVSLDARNPQAWALKGRALDELNNLPEAIRCYKTSLELNPNSVRRRPTFPSSLLPSLPLHPTSSPSASLFHSLRSFFPTLTLLFHPFLSHFLDSCKK